MKQRWKLRGSTRMPGRRGFILLAVIGFLLAGLSYELGQIRAGHNRLAALERQRELKSELRSADETNARLRERIAILETNEKVEAEGYRRVEDQLGAMQAKILQQQEDLAFYRGIVSSDQQADLRIQNFELSQSADSTSYLLKLVLAQAIRNDRKVSGQVELSVEGKRDGEPLTLGLRDLLAGDRQQDTMRFAFKYFQNLEANLVLPEGFAPDRVIVRLTPKQKSVKAVERTFDWPAQAG